MRALAILSLCLLAMPALAATPLRAGSWFGRGQPGDEHQFWLTHERADGGFQIIARRCEKGKAVDSVETGAWTVRSDGLVEVVTTRVDGRPVHFVDRYQDSFNGKTRREKHVWADYPAADGNYVFSSVLVPDDFRLPDCDAVS